METRIRVLDCFEDVSGTDNNNQQHKQGSNFKVLADGYPIKLIPTQIMIDSEGNPYNPSANLTKGMIKYSDDNDKTNKNIFTTHEGGLDKETIMTILKEMGLEE